MAEPTGVVDSSNRPGTPGGKKKNQKLLLLGGVAGLFLLLSHKGSSGSGVAGNDPNAALQAQSDALAQAQTDQALAAGAGGFPQPGGIAPTTVDTGGGVYNAPGSSIQVGGSSPSVTGGGSEGSEAPVTGPDAPITKGDVQGHFQGLFPTTYGRVNAIAKKVNQAPKHGKPAPAKKSGKVTHPSSGARVQGHTGVTVHGRTFPGATGHTIGPARRAGGNVTQKVTVNFGSHTETHTSVNQGQHWVENVKGHNPPSRGPQNARTSPVRLPARAPQRRPAPAPVRRPAARRR